MQKQLLGLKHLLIENHHFIFSSGYALTTGTYLIPTFQRVTMASDLFMCNEIIWQRKDMD